MALKFIDSYGHYHSRDLNKKYTSATGFDVDSQGGFGSASGLIQRRNFGEGGTQDVYNEFSAQDTWIVGFNFRIIQTPVDAGGTHPKILEIRDDATIQVQLQMTGESRLYVHRGNGGFLGVSSPLRRDTWYYIELKTVIGNSGSWELRINGKFDVGSSGVDTQESGNASANRIAYGSVGGLGNRGYYNYDDYYVCDGTGTKNNDFLGPCRAYHLDPKTATQSIDWIPSSTSGNLAMINETNPDSDRSYNAASLAGQTDMFLYDSLPVGTGSILGLQIATHIRVQSSAANFRPMIVSSAAVFSGSTVTPSQGYLYSLEVFELNPISNSSWSLPEVNSAWFGYQSG